MIRTVLILVASIVIALPFISQAFVIEADDNVLIDSVVEDTLITAGSTIQISSIVEGDAIVFGNTFTLTGDVYEDLWIAASTVSINGTVQDDLRIAASVVSVNEPVTGDLAVAASEITLNSTVGGNAHIVGSSLTMGEGARIEGDLTVSAEIGASDALASVVTGTITVLDTSERTGENNRQENNGFGRFGLVSKIVTAALIIALGGRFLAPIAKTAIDRLGGSILAGLGYFFGMPVLGLLLLMTGIFAPVAGLIIVDYLFAWILLSVIVAVVIAAYIVREYFSDNAQLQTRWGTTLVAGVILALLQIAPYVLTILLGVVAIGAMILYLWSMWKFVRSDTN